MKVECGQVPYYFSGICLPLDPLTVILVSQVSQRWMRVHLPQPLLADLIP